MSTVTAWRRNRTGSSRGSRSSRSDENVTGFIRRLGARRTFERRKVRMATDLMLYGVQLAPDLGLGKHEVLGNARQSNRDSKRGRRCRQRSIMQRAPSGDI